MLNERRTANGEKRQNGRGLGGPCRLCCLLRESKVGATILSRVGRASRDRVGRASRPPTSFRGRGNLAAGRLPPPFPLLRLALRAAPRGPRGGRCSPAETDPKRSSRDRVQRPRQGRGSRRRRWQARRLPHAVFEVAACLWPSGHHSTTQILASPVRPDVRVSLP